MKKAITILPIKYINGSINLPGSKSISNRALLLSAQSKGITYLTNILDCDDVTYMLTALKQIGIKCIITKKNNTCTIYGINGPLKTNSNETIFLGNSGTSMRLLTAALCLQNKNIILTGEPRMKERPIHHLVNALRQGGGIIKYLEKENYPPILIQGGYKGGKIKIKGNISSQFISSILMISPLCEKDSIITIKNKVVSKPYIKMTISMMKSFGITIKHDNYTSFYIKSKEKYISPQEYFIEGDASSASYFLAAGAIKGGNVKVTGINKNSIQGDIKFAEILKNIGAQINYGDNYIKCSKINNTLKPINLDMNDIPDVAMTAAILALFVNNQQSSTIRNIYNWRLKETDRLSAMSTELKKIGALTFEGKDYLTITPPIYPQTAKINTYNDHRIAMCFSLVTMLNIPITILNPQCVKKTFPNYFKLLFNISKS